MAGTRQPREAEVRPAPTVPAPTSLSSLHRWPGLARMDEDLRALRNQIVYEVGVICGGEDRAFLRIELTVHEAVAYSVEVPASDPFLQSEERESPVARDLDCASELAQQRRELLELEMLSVTVISVGRIHGAAGSRHYQVATGKQVIDEPCEHISIPHCVLDDLGGYCDVDPATEIGKLVAEECPARKPPPRDSYACLRDVAPTCVDLPKPMCITDLVEENSRSASIVEDELPSVRLDPLNALHDEASTVPAGRVTTVGVYGA